jgi:hypothetical protein
VIGVGGGSLASALMGERRPAVREADAFEELQEDEADRVAAWMEPE